MKVIPALSDDGGLVPAEPIPETAVRVVCDGKTYTVYEDGDELPKESEE